MVVKRACLHRTFHFPNILARTSNDLSVVTEQMIRQRHHAAPRPPQCNYCRARTPSVVRQTVQLFNV